MSALDLDAISQRSLRVAEASPVEYQWHAHTDVAILLEVDVPALHKEVRRLRAAEAERDELRAKVAEFQVAVSHSAESCADGPCEFHETVSRAESAEAKVAAVEAVRTRIVDNAVMVTEGPLVGRLKVYDMLGHALATGEGK